LVEATAHPRTIEGETVTVRKPGERFADVLDLTPEEHRQRGDAADAMIREFKRVIAEKLAKDRSD
jgi:hypothetical protein